MTKHRHIIARLADFPSGTRRVVPIGSKAGIGVYRVGDRFFALRNICPHEGAPLCEGPQRAHIRAERSGTRYQIRYEREGEIIACPWHEWEFDVTTGHALHDSRQRVKTYPIAVEGDEVVLYLEG